MRIVHEDSHLVVIDKPPGLLTATIPGEFGDSAFGFVKARVREQARRRGTKVWIIHRLDREASGLLVFAKTEHAYAVLKDDFKKKKAHRLYLAVVEGEFSDPGAHGTVQSLLRERDDGTVESLPITAGTAARRDHKRRDGRTRLPGIEADPPEAMLAVTHYRVLAVGKGRSLVQVRLETGRKHQIRVHMASLGRPVVGDMRYGRAREDERLCLHAAELALTDPETGNTRRFFSAAPADFYRLVGAKPPNAAPEPPAPDSWEHVAEWYDELIEERRSDHHDKVILPRTLRLLNLKPGERILDVACGQGAFCRELAALGMHAVGVDLAPSLIDFARAAAEKQSAPLRPEFLVGDARDLGTAFPSSPPFDATTCLMALMNIEPFAPVVEGVAALLRPGGRFVAVILHPAFRAPGRTSWGFDRAAGLPRQYRRVDAYLSPARKEIVMNPGGAAHGSAQIKTETFHRPIQAYIDAFSRAGLLVDALEEWASERVSEPGPRAREENRARTEIPLFLALRARRISTPTITREDSSVSPG